jgi:hypothetical protein
MFARLFLGQGDSKLAYYTVPVITVSSVPFPDLDFSRKKNHFVSVKVVEREERRNRLWRQNFYSDDIFPKGSLSYHILS